MRLKLGMMLAKKNTAGNKHFLSFSKVFNYPVTWNLRDKSHEATHNICCCLNHESKSSEHIAYTTGNSKRKSEL
jgi:hypothetical protein